MHMGGGDHIHVRDGDRGLGDVGAEHQLAGPIWGRRHHPHLLLRVLLGVQDMQVKERRGVLGEEVVVLEDVQ